MRALNKKSREQKKLKLINQTEAQKDQKPSRFTCEHIIRARLVVFHLYLLKVEIPKKYLQTLKHFSNILHVINNIETLFKHYILHVIIILSQQPLKTQFKESPP